MSSSFFGGRLLFEDLSNGVFLFYLSVVEMALHISLCHRAVIYHYALAMGRVPTPPHNDDDQNVTRPCPARTKEKKRTALSILIAHSGDGGSGSGCSCNRVV